MLTELCSELGMSVSTFNDLNLGAIVEGPLCTLWTTVREPWTLGRGYAVWADVQSDDLHYALLAVRSGRRAAANRIGRRRSVRRVRRRRERADLFGRHGSWFATVGRCCTGRRRGFGGEFVDTQGSGAIQVRVQKRISSTQK